MDFITSGYCNCLPDLFKALLFFSIYPPSLTDTTQFDVKVRLVFFIFWLDFSVPAFFGYGC